MCSPNARIDGPRELAGNRIGVAEYVQSATVWARGVLEHEFELDPRKAQWYVERGGSGSTGEVLGFNPPHDISVQQTPGGKGLVAMLTTGELDLALVGGNAQAQTNDALRHLFADATAEGERFYDAHGYVPATTHLTIMFTLRLRPFVVSVARAKSNHERPTLRANGLLR